jgi:hypothetical protein
VFEIYIFGRIFLGKIARVWESVRELQTNEKGMVLAHQMNVEVLP